MPIDYRETRKCGKMDVLRSVPYRVQLLSVRAEDGGDAPVAERDDLRIDNPCRLF